MSAVEQLSQNAVRQLLAKARKEAGRPPSPDAPRSWINPAVGEAANPLRGPAATPEPASVERRLVRRAEALWARLAESEPLPPAERAGELLRPPFAAQALMLEMPAGVPARISFVGDALALLSGLAPGPAEDSAIPSRLGTRLVGIARRAATLGEPCHYDSDRDRASAPAESADTQLLMRAIALPLSGVRGFPGAPGGAQGATALVIASWRKLLSAEETRALHRELAAAIDWMHRQGS